MWALMYAEQLFDQKTGYTTSKYKFMVANSMRRGDIFSAIYIV